MEYNIRDFTITDRETFKMLGNKFYQSDAVNCNIAEENFDKTFTMCIEKSPYVRGLLIETNGDAAGFALLAFTYSNESGGMVVWLEDLFILPNFQGKGLAKKFFEFIDNEYKHKVTRYRLEVTKNNTKAIEIYKKYGFSIMGYLPMIREL